MQVEFVDLIAHILNFVDKIEDSLVVQISISDDLSGRLRLRLLDDVEHLFKINPMLSKNRVREVVKVRFALCAPVLLCVLTGRTALDNVFTLAMDTRHRLAETGETETFEALLSWW